MLENIGKRIQTFLLLLIIVLLSLVMAVIGFGTPGAEGCATDGPIYAAKVYGETITEGDFRAAYNLTGFNRYETERARTLRLREYTLDGLIERELLVKEAERLGFNANEDDIMREVARDEVVWLGGPVDAPDGYPAGAIPQNFSDRDGNLSGDNIRRFIQYYLRRSVDEFVQWQVREHLANDVRDTVTASVSVSPREVWDAYVQDTDRARMSYVRFDPAYYGDQVEITDAALTAWMGQNEEAVDQEYRRQRHRYTDLPEQARVRQILVEVARDATDADRADARRRAEDLLRQVQGGADFATVARQHSDANASRGGDMGWFPRGRHPAPFEEAAFSLEDGALAEEIVETNIGFHVVKGMGQRQGDVPEADAKRELAEDLYRDARAGELAREDADRALAYLSDGHTMEELDARLQDGWAEPTPAPEGEVVEGEEAAEGEAPEPEEEEPAERDPRSPQVRETRSFTRSERAIPGPFDSGPLTEAAFEMSLDDPLPEAPIELGDSWFVYQLTERTEATEDGFDAETRAAIEERLLRLKRREALSIYIGQLRERAEAEGAIRINPAILSYGASEEEDEESGEETASL